MLPGPGGRSEPQWPHLQDRNDDHPVVPLHVAGLGTCSPPGNSDRRNTPLLLIFPVSEHPRDTNTKNTWGNDEHSF